MTRQLADCEAYVVRQGWEVAERYVDEDISAYKGKVRPAYRRLLDDIGGGYLDAVVVWAVDRLVRLPKELEEFLEVCEQAGVKHLASLAGDLDLSSHNGQLFARMLGAMAKNESDVKSRRVRRKHEELAEAGKVAGGGTRPYGYEADRLTVRESEAVVIRECVTRFLAGEALKSICRDLTVREVATVTGASWNPQTLRTLLQSARISGQRERYGEIVAPATWPAIITPAETTRIRGLLSDPDRRTNKVARRYLLVRLLRCGACGETLISRPRAGGDRGYVCAKGPGLSGCGHISALADPLEALVVEAVLYRLDSPELAAALAGSTVADPDSDRWQAEIDQSQAQLTELAQMWAAKEINRVEWQAARVPIEARVTDAKKQLSKLGRVSALDGHVGNASGLRERWPDLPLSRQHAIVAAVLDHVLVAPGRRGYNKFDPSRFTPVWRA